MAEQNAEYVRDANMLNLKTEALSAKSEYKIALKEQIIGSIITIIFIVMGYSLIRSDNHIAGTLFTGVGFIPVLLAIFYKPNKKK
jgi:ammonia channel protein AmtB